MQPSTRSHSRYTCLLLSLALLASPAVAGQDATPTALSPGEIPVVLEGVETSLFPSLVAVEVGDEIEVVEHTLAERTAVAGRRADLLLSAEIVEAPLAGREPAANPDIAVGPDGIIVVAGQNRIMWIPNPNPFGINLPYTPPAPGSPGIPSPLTNLNALRAGLPTAETTLEAWVGATVLNEICPGGFNPQTCLIQYPTVRYDQLHGHFLVAFAITDTGVRGPNVAITEGRASTWVLLVSRRATFLRPDGTLPAQIFSAPANPGSGFTADWYVYYGGRDAAGPSGFLNLNMYSTHPAAQPLAAPGRYSVSFPETNCNVPVGAQPPLSVSAPAGEETVCFLPTEVRLGIDADSVILVSPVLNANQIVPSSNTIPFTTGRFAGNRVRVLSKHQLYNFAGTFANGNPLVPGPYDAPRPYSGDVAFGLSIQAPAQTQFDMFRNTDLPAFCSVFDFATDSCTTVVAYMPPRRYTLGLEVSPTGSGIDTPRPPADPTTASALYPLYYEPVHLRGRALAKYANYPYGGATHLIGNFSFGTVGSGGNNWVQPIVYRADFRPALDAGDQTAIGIPGPRRQLVPDTVINPLQGPQDVACSTAPCSSSNPADPVNNVFVGDSRSQRAVAREGHIYQARTGRPSSNIFGGSIITPGPGNANAQNNPLWSTVYYDVAQMIYTTDTPALPAVGSTSPFTLPVTNPSLVFYTFWQNGHFYTPMFDVPANVVRGGAGSPGSALPFLDKLFVGTTSPRIGLPNTSGQGNIWPSLFDTRQGIDKYERFDFYRDPRSGRVINPLTSANATNLLATRAGGAVDPVAGGLWTYGAFADSRIGGIGQWATHAAYYDMTFSDTDPYGTGSAFFADVCPPGSAVPGCPVSPFFRFVQTARQLGLTQYLYGPGGAPLESTGIPPGHGIPGTPVSFQPGRGVTRAELAALVVYAVMDEAAVATYLGQTTPILFADVTTGAAGVDPAGNPAVLSLAQNRAIQVAARRGWITGCAVGSFCPFAFATRADAAEIVVKAKASNVHPTSLSACPTPLAPGPCVAGGDNFWRLLETSPYFPADVPVTHPSFAYVQSLRHLGITSGTGAGTFNPGGVIDRGQLATFLTRAFHF